MVKNSNYQNLPNKKGYPEGHFPVLHHMSVPIFDKNKNVAIMGVGSKEEPYNDADVRQLKLFMNSMWRIIKQKRVEVKLKESEKKYRTAFEQANFYKDLFSHDINNVLSVIKSSLDLYTLDKSNLKNMNTIVSLTQESVDKGIKLISKVRKFSQLDDLKPAIKKVELTHVLDIAINYVNSIFHER